MRRGIPRYDEMSNIENCGCLSKELEKFLSLDDDLRKKEYGKDTDRFYLDIINSVNQSFKDHLLVLSKLPQPYREKIDFLSHCEAIKSAVMRKNWTNGHLQKVIGETIQNLEFIKTEINNKNLLELSEKDFERIIDWLRYLKETNS